MAASPRSVRVSNHTSTPRSSTDLQPPRPSPNYHGLQLRPRLASNASHPDSPPQPTPDPNVAISDKALKNDAVRSAKRILHATIRDDWNYPCAVEGEEEENRDPTGFVCRETGSSDLELEESGSSRHGAFTTRENNPYRFENPDAIATSIMEKRRRRQKAFEDEMKWNDGLRIWSLRRDAWTKAVRKRPPKRRVSSQSSRKRGSSTLSKSEWPFRSGSTTSSDPSVPSSSSMDSVSVEELESPLDGPWLPVFPPIIPADNLVRINIKPSAYSNIYSKVVIQSLTPSICIPLSHMTNALVEGWKAEGAWPPQPTAAASAVLREGKRKTSALFNVMRMRRGHQGHVQGKDGGVSREKANEKVKKGLSTVKRALGVGGGSGDEFGIDYEESAESRANAELNNGLLEGG